MEAVLAQDNDTEASHGTTVEEISIDYGVVSVEEGTEARQDELTIEEDSIGSGTTDSDGAQARGAESGGKIL